MNSEPSATPPAPPGRRKWRWWLAGVLLLVAVVVALAPWVIAKTGLRDQLFALLVDDPQVVVRSENASFGYFSPLSVSGLKIDSTDGRSSLQIDRILTDRSWLHMLLSRPELGTLTVSQPTIDVIVDELPESGPPPDSPGLLPVLTARIQDAAVIVRLLDQSGRAAGTPAVQLRGVNFTVHLQRDGQGSVFVVDPVTLFDHHPLTPQICKEGLELVAPLMSGHLGGEGEFSLELTGCRIPVPNQQDDDPRQLELAGTVQLHSARVGLENPALSRMIGLVTGLLGTRLPENVQLTEDCVVEFQVADGKIRHDGFALVLPHRKSGVRLRTSGVVGLDRSLDIRVQIDLPPDVLGDTVYSRELSADSMVFRLTGTVDQPRLEFGAEQEWLTRIQKLLLAPSLDGGIDAAVRSKLDEFLGDLVGDDEQREKQLLPEIRDRLRSSRQRRPR